MHQLKPHRTLFDPYAERDSCGVGFVANVTGAKSREVLARALDSVVNVTHRGAVSADARTGDGAGITAQIPFGIFGPLAAGLGHDVVPGEFAVGVVFARGSERAIAAAHAVLEEACRSQELPVLGWRAVPTAPGALGEQARNSMPRIDHLLVGKPHGTGRSFEQRLYTARRAAEARFDREQVDCYVASFSSRTIVYKGLVAAPQLEHFYPDLSDARFETALALFHQRYSTNTFSTWRLSQPFRLLAHNGEINTLQGNQNWMRAREPEMSEASRLFGPVIQAGGSDSSNLDNVLELLLASGRDLLHSMSMLVPEAWENMPNLDPTLRAFYEYHACLTEPWDGPAALALTDGVVVAATLDRNGLRPARYKLTEDDILVMASEVGTTDLDEGRVVEKGRIGPGQIIAVDTARGVLLRNDEIRQAVASQKPYGEWLRRKLVSLGELPTVPSESVPESSPDLRLQRAFAYTTEESNLMLRPMYFQGVEPVFSLGDDTPLAVLATRPRLLYNYFRQRFAQVTNPPIDPLREQIVMSLYTYLGRRQSLLEETEEHAALLRLDGPILTDEELARLRERAADVGQRVVSVPVLYEVAEGSVALRRAVDDICAAAERAVDAGATILVLSDRGVNEHLMAVPMLMAVGSVHHHLIRAGKRMRASIVVETAEAREMHQFCLLSGYGASAINPYLALATVRRSVVEGQGEDISPERAEANYLRTVHKQVLKIMSKMGISTVTAYHGAQIFEAIGISPEIIDRCFTGTPSPVGGIGFERLAEELAGRHAEAFGSPGNGRARLDDHGFFRYRRGGEPHAYSPQSVRILHDAVQEDGTGMDGYREYVRVLGQQEPISLRDLLRFRTEDVCPVPLEEVESAEVIVLRFSGGSMSFGALSIEAHEAIAIGFNRLGSKSGSGEGGEDPRRFRERLPNGDQTGSKMKQVASGRFGVTPEYLAMAEVLEIKMAQGSKPGEGGQLPGHKVTEVIAHARRTQAGVPLISPPPHHDIYSIEDLAQLIYDLKVVNPRAKIAVKLVAEAGVGTIAAGVAKAYADYILISGAEGGTGASPLVSIKYAGAPWELGLAETQRVLVQNGLRGRVVVRTDGGLRTGRDVAIAAVLGAEEYGFGTSAMVAVGCQVARQCHLNTCPVGVATQDPELRKRFWGTPDMLVRYLFYVAEELRAIMASLGVRTVAELIGRTDLLEQVALEGHPKANTVDLTAMLAPVDPTGTRPLRSVQERNDRPHDDLLDDELLPLVLPALEGRGSVALRRKVRNTHRAVGARIAGEIASLHGDGGLPPHSIELHFAGSAGQSFGAFLVPGMHLTLEGEANDYVGKGMHGGELVLRPSALARFKAHENVIMGNTVLYGATGGQLFAAGRAGERFAVRNSGAWAVVEGTGDHACEYMTGGVVVSLGPVGRNVGAGMSGGVAYIMDEDNSLSYKLNPEMVGVGPVEDGEDETVLHALVERHHHLTGSIRAREILARWSELMPRFRKVLPLPHVAPPPPRDQQRARRDALRAMTSRMRSS